MLWGMLGIGKSYIVGAVLIDGGTEIGLVENHGPVGCLHQWISQPAGRDKGQYNVKIKWRTYQRAACGCGGDGSGVNQAW